jgi:CRP-like cAMP-binding protein
MAVPILSKADAEGDDVAFPKLDALEIEIAKQCGQVEVYEAGESIYKAGDQPLDCFVIVTGKAQIIDPSGDEERVLVEYGSGGFTGDITFLTQGVALPALIMACMRCIRRAGLWLKRNR